MDGGINEIRDWAVLCLSTMARPARRPGNLPAEATSFIGRRRELAEVRKTLAAARLVTLVGPGGVGKSRLAVNTATRLARGFHGGAWLVELAEVGEPALVGNAVMAALDLRDQATAEPRTLLLSYLRDKRLLLVVDNCEHLLHAAAGLLAELMRVAPGVRVLATSREPLSVPGEHVVAVPPLELPPAQPALTLAQLRLNEAVMLFADRAVASCGHFTLTTENQGAVVDLCRRLDGLPLAIELAAVRTRVLAVEQIRDRLTDRFGLLTGGSRAALPRHQTLRTTIDWSHDLLATGEQALLRRLYVFGGRFTVDDVEAVCTSDDVPAARTLDMLASLVDKSLVQKEDVGDVACYHLHETMREYAGLRLRQAGEERAVADRCAGYYLQRCRGSAAQARYRLDEWLDWMDLQSDNIRAVLRRCVAGDDTQRVLALALASSLGWYWVTRATSEGVRWFDELIAGSSSRPALALFLRGFLAVLQSDHASARPVLDEAIAAARLAGQPSLLSLSLSLASIAAHLAGDRAATARLLAEAHAVTGGLDDFPATIMLVQARALNALIERDLDTARCAAVEGVRLTREVGDLYSLEMMLLNLGCAALLGGQADRSKPLFTEALGIARRIDDRVGQYCVLDALGCHAAATGQPRLAARLLGAADTLRASVGGSLLPHFAPLLTEVTASTSATLGAPAFQAEFQTGKRLHRDAAIRLALGEPDPVAPALTSESPLGKREAQVATLVADGLSNKQIGTRLLISEHTVDTHIRNIMNKLGVDSRAQIAAWLAAATR